MSKPSLKQASSNKCMPDLNFLVALACEAKPLIDFYRLKKLADKPFPYFQNTKSEGTRSALQTIASPQINLIVSGIGLQNMAMACGWLGALKRGNDEASIWLNVGTAGHRSLPIGETVIIARSSDINGARDYYPPQVAKWPAQSVSVLTNNAPCTEYPESDAVDMEASAFFNAANKLSSSELVQSLKVISDNQDNDLNRLNAATISQLLADNVSLIDEYAAKLLAVATSASGFSRPTEQDLKDQLAHLHCTVSEFQQYRDLTNKLENIGIGADRTSVMASESSSMLDLLKQLRTLQESTAPDLSLIGQGL